MSISKLKLRVKDPVQNKCGCGKIGDNLESMKM